MNMKQSEKGNVVEVVTTSVILPLDLKRRIRILGAQNGRSMGAEIRAAMEAHLAANEKGAA